jgi:nicotinate-nucleotide adenylyltransferase
MRQPLAPSSQPHAPMHLGIFGGSFDPVHNGHLELARACQAPAALDEIWFMPTAVQPLKRHGPHATDVQRMEMLQLAIKDESLGSEPAELAEARPRNKTEWRVSTLEIDRRGLSYTVDTLRQIHTELPEAKLYFLVGADAAREAPLWKEPAEIFRLATPLVVRRAGEPEPDLSALAGLCPPQNWPQLVEMPAVDVSSSDIRRRIAAGESIDDLVPPAVARYIADEQLYR